MKKNISKKAVEKIKKEKICPEPKWKFILLNCLFWIFALLMTLFGAIAFSLILFAVFELDWDLYRHTPYGMIKFFFITIPYIWITLFALFFLFGCFIFRKTKKGYRHNFILIGGIITVLSLLSGTALHYSGIDDEIQQMFLRIPRYHKLAPTREGQWGKPQKGLLGGEVKEIGSNTIILKDFRNKEWEVHYSDETHKGRITNIQKGDRIKIIGSKIGESAFDAKAIRPWRNRQGYFKKDTPCNSGRPCGRMMFSY